MKADMFSKHDTAEPLGDGRLQITALSDADWSTALLTVRGKDHDLTADQFDALAEACRQAAARIRSRKTR